MRISDWSSDVCSSDLPLLCREWCPDHIYTIHPASADRMRAFDPLQSAGKAATGQPRPTLRIRDVVAIPVGIAIRAGIFPNPSLGGGAAGHAAMLRLAWAWGGVLSLLGAPCYATPAAITARPA